MSSSKYDKIGNYNLSYELLKDAVAEFDGYILGLSQNDIWLFAEKAQSEFSLTNKAIEPIVLSPAEKNLDKFLKDLAPRVLDRTTGTYLFKDLLGADSVSTLKNSAIFDVSGETKSIKEVSADDNFPRKVMTFVPGSYPEGLGSSKSCFVSAMRGFDPTQDETNTDPRNKQQTINDCLYYYNVKGIISEQAKKQVKDEKTGKLVDELQYEDKDKKKPVMHSVGVAVDDSKFNAVEVNKTVKGVPDRFNSPSLGALVMQHPKASNASKGKDHLPIFFNAIPPIEMSRCVPYLDVRVLTENYSVDQNGNKTSPSRLNNVAFMRFTKEVEGRGYVLDDSVGFGDLSPVNTSMKEDERKATENVDISYMDIFTSPQTLANANINGGSASGEIGSGDRIKSLIGGGINDDPILEPIMPFLSLDSLNVSITGAGYGIMASKKASLKLTLHDRSRLRDLAPLVSSSQFATTRILIEYGWNHPDGGPGSNNTIGKYLNALKERSVYQVVKCDYDFSEGGAVGINIGLAAYGFRQTERVHCGAGPEVPLNVFSEYIDKVNDDLRKKLEVAERGLGVKAPEVRQKLKMNARASRSTLNSLSWSSYRLIMNALNSGDEKSINALKYVFELESITDGAFKRIRRTEIKNNELGKGSLGLKVFERLEEAGLFQEDTKETMLQRLYGKIKAFEDPDIADPFISAVIYESNLQKSILGKDDLLDDFLISTPAVQKARFLFNDGIKKSKRNVSDHVTLGKAIANLVGFPLAATCLYDEVQMIFYPLNHQSGGARVHTTASLPIPISKIRSEVQDAVKKSSNISVKRAFSILEKIVKDKNLEVYNIYDVKHEDDFDSKEELDQLLVVLNECCAENNFSYGFSPDPGTEAVMSTAEDADTYGVGLIKTPAVEPNTDYLIFDNYFDNKVINYSNKKSLDTGDFSAKSTKYKGRLFKRLKQLLAEKKRQRALGLREELGKKLKSIYTSDGLSTLFPALDKFVRPNISLDFEVVDAIDVNSGSELPGPLQRFVNEIAPSNDDSNGLLNNKTILRLHIYDEETVMSPAENTLMSTVTEGTTGMIIEGDDTKKSIHGLAKSLNFNQAKQYIKRTYPTIIYGSAGSTVRNLSVSANTSGEMANILMVESYGNLKNAQVSGINNETNFESVTMFPNTVSCTLMGMPMIGRGNTIFIDFGTNTSLDNIYTVKNVTHTIRAGDFSTTLDLVPPNMGAVEGFAKNISKTFAPSESKTTTGTG